MMKTTVILSELSDETAVFQEEEYIMIAQELRRLILGGSEDRKDGWLVGVPEVWTLDAESMLDDYIESESVEMYENADEAIWDQVKPLLPQIQLILNGVEIRYYSAGDSIEIDDISHSSCTYCGTNESLTIGSDETCICPDCLSECEPIEDDE